MSKLRRYRVKLAGSDHTVVMQLDPDTAKERYPEAVEVTARAAGDTRTKSGTPGSTKTGGKTPAKTPAKEPATGDVDPKE